MCGIFCSVSRHEHVAPSDSVKKLLQARGPDASRQLELQCPNSAGTISTHITCLSTVLSLRGSVTVPQPFQKTDSKSTLCWNGEAWSVRSENVLGNDTAVIFDLLQQSVDLQTPPMDAREEAKLNTQNVARALSQVAGPYAFVFFDEANSRLHFGRDFLGRRSLLWSSSPRGDIMFSSVTNEAPTEGWVEVEADGIYSIDLSERSYAQDVSEDELSHWGSFVVCKVPYSYAGADGAGDVSVIPELLLNRQTTSKTMILNQDAPLVLTLHGLLRDSVSTRVLNIPEPPATQNASVTPRKSKLAILFSGGLDCTVLARISHDLIPPAEPIDLLNVAFQNPRVHKSTEAEPYELCPDRITGRQTYAELCAVCPGREWRFVSIDIPYVETQSQREQVITLMHPHNTEMDLSIGFALYFASRGSGRLRTGNADEVIPYSTSARVLLSGLGADELFAGYTRHATAFKWNGLDGLLDELDLDIGRLGKRNLGRDDRVISHWGREVRFPFLDEALVQWAVTAPITNKCDFGAESSAASSADSCESIEPGKKVLRCLAWRLGMKQVAREKKRAIQFGARTAKMETGKTKGTTLLS